MLCYSSQPAWIIPHIHTYTVRNRISSPKLLHHQHHHHSAYNKALRSFTNTPYLHRLASQTNSELSKDPPTEGESASKHSVCSVLFIAISTHTDRQTDPHTHNKASCKWSRRSPIIFQLFSTTPSGLCFCRRELYCCNNRGLYFRYVCYVWYMGIAAVELLSGWVLE